MTTPTPTPSVTIRSLGLPRGTDRIWRDERTGNLLLRPIEGFGPRGHQPVGYLTPDDAIVTEQDATVLTGNDLRFLELFYAGANRGVNDTVDMTEQAQRAAAGYSQCWHCGNVHGKAHSLSCVHHGLTVGDKVR